MPLLYRGKGKEHPGNQNPRPVAGKKYTACFHFVSNLNIWDCKVKVTAVVTSHGTVDQEKI